MSTRVLFVCLGNICRSPTAEGVLRAIAAREFATVSLEIDSAGTADYHVGEPPDGRTIAHAHRRGYDLGNLRARQLVEADFDRFDHLFAMDHNNLRDLRQRMTAGARTQPELFLEYAPEMGCDEVPDPYYGGAADFERVLDLCEAAARGFLRTL